jgi:hypothetical protein
MIMEGMHVFGLIGLVFLVVAVLVLVALVYSQGKKCRKSKKCCSSAGCGSSASASSSSTLAYAVLSNQSLITGAAANALFAATPAGNLTGGITLNSTTGVVTLPMGTFLVQYSARFARSPGDTQSASAQLQQTVAGVAANIAQPAIVNASFVDGLIDAEPLAPYEITGDALITVTSTLDNNINLLITPAVNATLPAATGSDANAQLTILQLN